MLSDQLPTSSTTSQELITLRNSSTSSGLAKSFGELLQSGSDSDASIKCTDDNGCQQTIDAHRLVLSARSEVFRAMFKARAKGTTTEAESGVVRVDDVHYAPLKSLIQFCYTERCQVESDSLCAILVAADKYQVLDLKECCERELVSRLTPSTVIDMLMFSSVNSALTLRRAAIALVQRYVNSGKIVLRQEDAFEKLMLTDMKLVEEVFYAIGSVDCGHASSSYCPHCKNRCCSGCALFRSGYEFKASFDL